MRKRQVRKVRAKKKNNNLKNSMSSKGHECHL